jgi:hypothetical protein
MSRAWTVVSVLVARRTRTVSRRKDVHHSGPTEMIETWQVGPAIDGLNLRWLGVACSIQHIDVRARVLMPFRRSVQCGSLCVR